MWIVFACVACDAVPDVSFEDDAAIVPDGGNTCSSIVPAYATQCCGPIACSGTMCTAACSDCVQQCALAELRRPNAQGHVICKANLQCP